MNPKILALNLLLAGLGIFSFIAFGAVYKAYPEKVSSLLSLPEKPQLPPISLESLLPSFPKAGPSPTPPPSVEVPSEAEREPSPPPSSSGEPGSGERGPAGGGVVVPREGKLEVGLPKEIKTEVKISDKDINQYLAQIPTGSLPLADPRVAFSEGKVVVSGRLKEPIEGDLRAEVKVFLVNKKQVGVKVEQATINNFPLPVFLLPQLETPFNEFIASQLGDFVDYKIESLEIEGGLLILTGSFSL